MGLNDLVIYLINIRSKIKVNVRMLVTVPIVAVFSFMYLAIEVKQRVRLLGINQGVERSDIYPSGIRTALVAISKSSYLLKYLIKTCISDVTCSSGDRKLNSIVSRTIPNDF